MGQYQEFTTGREPEPNYFELGVNYACGRQVDADLIEAHKWFNLAALRGDVEAARRRQELAAEPGQEWDAVLLVRYPHREAFSRMVADPEYQQVTSLRTEALTEAVLQATVPW